LAVVSVTTNTVKPDRFEDYLELIRNGRAIFERCGAKNVRLLAALVAGEATGSFAFIWEADDFAAWGEVFNAFLTDSEGQAMTASAGGDPSPVPGYQNTVWVDVPL
jgi:hypothetical protein